MKRSLRISALILVTAGLSYSCADDLSPQQPSEPTGKSDDVQPGGRLASADAIFLDFEWDGLLLTDQTYDPSSDIERQLFYTVGHLNGDDSVGRLDRVQLSNIQQTEIEDGRIQVTYHARMQVAWGKSDEEPPSYKLLLPRDLSYEGEGAFVDEYKHDCVDWGAHDVDRGSLWYYYRPRAYACPFRAVDEHEDLFIAPVTISRSAEETREKYPEYHQIFKDDWLKVVAVYGKYEEGATSSGDAGIGAYNSFVRTMKSKLAELGTLEALRPDASGSLQPVPLASIPSSPGVPTATTLQLASDVEVAPGATEAIVVPRCTETITSDCIPGGVERTERIVITMTPRSGAPDMIVPCSAALPELQVEQCTLDLPTGDLAISVTDTSEDQQGSRFDLSVQITLAPAADITFRVALAPVEGQPQRHVEVAALMVDHIRHTSPEFDTRYRALTAYADLIGYNGHSGLGQNIRALARKGTWVRNQYAIVYLNGCDSYAYVDSALDEAHEAVNPGRPGSEFLDTLVNAMPSYFSSMDDSMVVLVEGLLSYARGNPMDYRALLDTVPSSQIVLVTGEEDNVYDPDNPPPDPPPSGELPGVDPCAGSCGAKSATFDCYCDIACLEPGNRDCCQADGSKPADGQSTIDTYVREACPDVPWPTP